MPFTEYRAYVGLLKEAIAYIHRLRDNNHLQSSSSYYFGGCEVAFDIHIVVY
jgi:hypothetical protein